MPTIWNQQPSWTQQIGGLARILGTVLAHTTLRSQPFESSQPARCSSSSRYTARLRKCVPGEGSSSEARRQEQLLWRNFFLDPVLWWENRPDQKPSHSHRFRRKGSGDVLWRNKYKPAWVDERMVALDIQVGRGAHTSTSSLPEKPYTSRHAGYDTGVTAITVSALCQQGTLTEGIEALEVLAQTDCPISKSLVYTVLKQCVTKKDLVLGRRVHALTVKMGYESDTFLSNHILRMYASHARLQEAMDVFTRVATPDAFMWSSIISAHVKQGLAKQAIQLYHQMRITSVKPDGHLFVAALRACARGADLETGQQVHADVLASGVEPGLYVVNCLVDMYVKCGNLKEAQRLFDRLPQKDVVTWTAMIAGYAKSGSLQDAQSLFDRLPHKNVMTWTAMIAGYSQQGLGQQALHLYSAMQEEGIAVPDSVTFACLLQACASMGTVSFEKGKQLHAQIEERGFEADLVVGGGLVNMYAKCGSLQDAKRVFYKLPQKNVVTWNAMIAGYSHQGMGKEALHLYSAMQEEDITAPDSVTFVCLLQACASLGSPAMEKGKQLHAQIGEQGLEADVVIGGSLVNMYAKCGSLADAQTVFDRLPQKNVVTWNAMVAGYSQQGMGLEALHLYSAMQEEGIASPDSVTFVCLLQACASVGTTAMMKGKQLHAQIGERGLDADVVIGTSLVNMYAKCGSLKDAQSMFDRLPQKNVVSWSAMIAGYSQQGMGEEALHLYCGMREEGIAAPNFVTFVCLLQACASVGPMAMEKGKQLHAQIGERGLEADVVLGGSLVNMYAKCGCLMDAQSVFDRLPEKNVATWNAMIAGYSQEGMGEEALHIYTAMQEEGIAAPDSVTFVCLLQACASVGATAMENGKQLHAQIGEQGLEVDVVLGNSLVNMYAKCGSLKDAQSVFDRLPAKNVVTWSALIAGYSQQGMGLEALHLYSAMQQEGITAPNSVTFVCLLQACAIVAALPIGNQLHAQIEERGLETDGVIGGSLVNMYAKCGSMVDAQRVFDALPERDIVAWNALIAGYTRHGDSDCVFALVHTMTQDDIQPNSITFLSVLTVCSHSGHVNKGQEYFEAMSREYGISPTVEHYTCMVDILGRAGQLDEALEVVRTMPVQSNAVVWHALLGACRKWRNVQVGRRAFDEAVKLNEKDVGAYVTMSNIYTGAQMWKEAHEIRMRRINIGARKPPGESWWTDPSGRVHSFLVGDKKHPDSEGIYARLEQLVPKMKKEGYVPNLDSSLRGTSDVDKEAHLCGHSERLAIAYALNKTPEGTTIRIVKNLRVCDDCHAATAYISKLEKRTIICRDASRFHVYREGKCSCGDYW